MFSDRSFTSGQVADDVTDIDLVMRAAAPFSPVAVVGHRGSGGNDSGTAFAENTPDSFAAAVRAGATWIETDARVTLDGHLVLSHDLTVRACRVNRLTRDEALVLGAHPASVLDDLPRHVGVNLEVKASLADIGSSGTHAAAARFLAERQGERPLLMSSFDSTAQHAAAEAGVPFGMLFEKSALLDEAFTMAGRLGAQAVHVYEDTLWRWEPSFPDIEECLDAARSIGMQVMVWGATDRTASCAHALGLDALCVDDIPGTVARLDEGATVPAQTAPANLLRV